MHDARLDVTDRAAVLAYADEVAAHYGTVNIVINNAGIAFTGDIEDMSFEQIERVMDVDFWGVVNGTKAFLPHLIASGDGHVVNISSLFGLLAVPGQSAYNAAKFAVRGFTEALRQEMLITGHNVNVTCVHPGGIKTAIARNAGAVEGQDAAALAEFFDAKLAKTTPEAAGQVDPAGRRRATGRGPSSASTPSSSTSPCASSARPTSGCSSWAPDAPCRARRPTPPSASPAIPAVNGRVQGQRLRSDRRDAVRPRRLRPGSSRSTPGPGSPPRRSPNVAGQAGWRA